MKTQVLFLSAFAAAAIAQDSACSSSSGLTIQNQGDVSSSLSNCQKFTGDITIAPQTAGTINIGNVQEITGDLTVDGSSGLTSLSADSLKTIGGTFTLNNLTTLSSTSFPYLTSVSDMEFQGVPNLRALGFTQSVKTVNTLNIQNTGLSSLDGLNPQAISSIYIANNPYLQTISFQVGSVSKSINIQSNGDRLNVQFPNLQTAANVTFRNCPTVNIDSMMNVTGSLGFYSSSLSSISAVNLTSVGLTLAINTNSNLSNVSLPVLATIGGGFQVQNNTQLTNISLPSLATIKGALDFYGAFDSVDLPALKDCEGGFNIQSSSSSQTLVNDCANFKNEAGLHSVIKGKFYCSGNVSAPGNSTSNPKTGTKSSASSILSSSSLLFVAGVVALFMGSL